MGGIRYVYVLVCRFSRAICVCVPDGRNPKNGRPCAAMTRGGLPGPVT